MKASALILDLLRTYGHTGAPVRTIMATGNMFGLSENVMRVNLTRLTAKGRITKPKRGFYRLSERADPVGRFVERWREGEDRVRAWDGLGWLLVHASASANNTERPEWALETLGFVRVASGLWIRPDNLNQTHDSVVSSLNDLGMPAEYICAAGARLESRISDRWFDAFDFSQLQAQYVFCRQRIEESLDRLPMLPREKAMKESFHRGGAAVHILAKDPLVPEQAMDISERRALWQIMLEYDRAGRAIWAADREVSPTGIPMPAIQAAR